MRLVSIYYEKDNVRKDIVFLLLLETEDKYIGLRSDKLSTHDIDRIRRHSIKLENMENDELIPWFKENVRLYRKAYREISRDRATITGEYDISG